MPSAFHPRSKQTTSLFGLTLGVAFLVVGMPHILPCPAPRRTFADSESRGRVREDREIYIDSEGRRRQRVRRKPADQTTNPDKFTREQEAERLRAEAHQCPVPKPTGILGRLLGFSATDDGSNQEGSMQPSKRGKERQHMEIRPEAPSRISTQPPRSPDGPPSQGQRPNKSS